jgi:hypothetical protein
MATTLWPIIHRLSNLLALKRELDVDVRSGDRRNPKAAVLRTELETTAGAIETALENWVPCLPPGCEWDENDRTKVMVPLPEDGEVDAAAEKSRRIHSILNNALAYRHSAFVYLYRTICGHGRQHRLVQRHTHLALTHCAATVSHAGPMGALLWPLFVAACEAVAADDRELVGKAFAALDKRQGMMNIERSWDIVREVWRRADKMDDGNVAALQAVSCGRGAELWRRVSDDMGIRVVFG